jgi:hypothetical protein
MYGCELSSSLLASLETYTDASDTNRLDVPIRALHVNTSRSSPSGRFRDSGEGFNERWSADEKRGFQVAGRSK